MRMKRLAIGGLFVAALVALLAWSGGPSRSPIPTPPVPDPGSATGPVLPRESVEYSSLSATDVARWRANAALLSERCDLEARTACSGASCATVAWLPDLDSLRGWASLGWNHPGLFAVSVLGDRGIEPPGGWPCTDAVREFFDGATPDVAIGDGPRGTWVVCAASSGEEAAQALCTTTAAALGLPWTGIDSTRHL